MKKEIHSEHLTLSDLYPLSCPLNEDDCKRLLQADGRISRTLWRAQTVGSSGFHVDGSR